MTSTVGAVVAGGAASITLAEEVPSGMNEEVEVAGALAGGEI